MSDHKEIYQQQAEQYERLVSHEDYQHNILKAILEITPLEGKEVVELGAGTGRLTCMLAPIVRSIRAFDAAEHMLAVAERKLKATGLTNWQLEVSDNRKIAISDGCADITLSGWSICYLVDWGGENWQGEVTKALCEMERILKPNGVMILLETLGTGFTTPTPPDHLKEYYAFLAAQGFTSNWMRTDYQFDSIDEGNDLAGFFFGEEMKEKIENGEQAILPECTGLWWKRKDQRTAR